MRDLDVSHDQMATIWQLACAYLPVCGFDMKAAMGRALREYSDLLFVAQASEGGFTFAENATLLLTRTGWTIRRT